MSERDEALNHVDPDEFAWLITEEDEQLAERRIRRDVEMKDFLKRLDDEFYRAPRMR